MINCPCGSGKLLKDCCQPIIQNQKDAITAEELMRSRYTAFTLADVGYLMKSHHSKTRPIKEKKNIKKWAESVQWMGLTIINKTEGSAKDTKGMVEFKAVFIENGKLDHIHECSLFEKENGKWVYFKGTHQ
ncbi:Sec-C motif domain protein [Labilibacter sediminis]|nr:Sec-C motif domain protein [Labilibacter sediminis]